MEISDVIMDAVKYFIRCHIKVVKEKLEFNDEDEVMKVLIMINFLDYVGSCEDTIQIKADGEIIEIPNVGKSKDVFEVIKNFAEWSTHLAEHKTVVDFMTSPATIIDSNKIEEDIKKLQELDIEYMCNFTSNKMYDKYILPELVNLA